MSLSRWDSAGALFVQGVHARKVVGVEMVQQAVEDAEANAQLNGICSGKDGRRWEGRRDRRMRRGRREWRKR